MNLFSILGNPVSHSISPRLHNSALEAFGIEGCYIRRAITDENLLLPTFHAMQLDGANVTVPHKEVAYTQCDEVRGIAQKIGAVNTLVKEGQKVIGYNTDAQGFLEAIRPFGKIKTALILGAGGTAKAIATILQENHVQVTILNRSAQRLEFFETQGFTCHTWETFDSKPFDLIINTTSAGLKDEELPCPRALLESLFKQSRFAFDVIYNKKTPFLQMAELLELMTLDGKDMLLHQAVLAFNLFFNNRYDTKTIEKVMEKTFKI